MKSDVNLLLTFILTLVLLCFYQAGYSIGKRAAERWWQHHATINAGGAYQSHDVWAANDIAIHPPYSRATVDDLLCGKIGIYVYDHCENEAYYRGKDLPCYDAEGNLKANCSHHTDAPIFPANSPPDSVQIEVKRAKKAGTKRYQHDLRPNASVPELYFDEDDKTLAYYSTFASCAEIKEPVPCLVMLDIVNAKPGDYGWFHGIATTAEGSSRICALMGIEGFQISRIGKASCHAQDWAAAGGKATVEIKKP